MQVSPSTIDWASLHPGELPSSTTTVALDRVTLCRDYKLNATCNSSALICTIVPNEKVRFDHHEEESATPIAQELGQLTVRLRESVEPVTSRQDILITVSCQGVDRARLMVPVTWKIAPIIEVSPSRGSLGLRKPGEPTRFHVILRSEKPTPFRVRSVNCDDREAFLEFHQEILSDTQHRLILDLRMPKVVGVWRTTARVETDREGAENLAIPLSAIIEDGASERED